MDTFYFSCFINEQGKQAKFFIMSKDCLYPITAEHHIVFFIEIEIKKANKNHINILHENYKYIASCFEASDG